MDDYDGIATSRLRRRAFLRQTVGALGVAGDVFRCWRRAARRLRLLQRRRARRARRPGPVRTLAPSRATHRRTRRQTDPAHLHSHRAGQARSAGHRCRRRSGVLHVSQDARQIRHRHALARRRRQRLHARHPGRATAAGRQPGMAGGQQGPRRQYENQYGADGRVQHQAGHHHRRQRHSGHGVPVVAPDPGHPPVPAEGVRRSHALRRGRRHQGLSQPGQHSAHRLEADGLQQRHLRRADPASVCAGHLVRQPVALRIGRRWPAEGRRRVQADPPAADQSCRQPVGHQRRRELRVRADGHHVGPAAVDVPRAEQLEGGLQRQIHQRHRDGGIQGRARLHARPVGVGTLLRRCADDDVFRKQDEPGCRTLRGVSRRLVLLSGGILGQRPQAESAREIPHACIRSATTAARPSGTSTRRSTA